ncbi:bifunctional glutamate N-acetyltransferase/amino-acid acetyltransferase ArgJ [Elusimicrobiota bacterium]
MEFPAGFNITGIKGENNNNLALITALQGMKTAAVFTVNTCPAHPVIYSREKIKNDIHKAILVNKGIANAATGDEGRKRMMDIVNTVCKGLNISEEEILVASTGVIGKQLNIPDDEINNLIAAQKNVEPMNFAEAIMTTDTCNKVAWSSYEEWGKKISVFGIAKGAGMVAPNLATMLAFIMTNVNIEKEALQIALERAVEVSFNCLNIDGETSTNDTVFLSASGEASNEVIKYEEKGFKTFYEHLQKVCIVLVEKLAADGEGATKLIKIKIYNAPDKTTAKKAARVIASSPLCKTAFYGSSPNWGRIVSALGAAGVELNISQLNIYVNGVSWIKKGKPHKDSIQQVREVMGGGKYELAIDLSSGSSEGVSYTCDFSPEYVRINAHYVT